MRVGWLKMAIFASFVHCLLNIWPHDSFQVIQLSMTLGIFQGQWIVSHQISQKRCVIRQKLLQTTNRKSYTSFRLVPLLMTLKYFEGHFSLGCHFHIHFSNPWHAIASHGLPAIAELLVLNLDTAAAIEVLTFCPNSSMVTSPKLPRTQGLMKFGLMCQLSLRDFQHYDQLRKSINASQCIFVIFTP